MGGYRLTNRVAERIDPLAPTPPDMRVTAAHPQRVGHHADETSSLMVRSVTSTLTARPSSIGERFRTQ
jgi:hypothetical protein